MSFDFRQVIESEQNGINYDPDSSPKTWEYYRRIYTTEHWSLFSEFDLINLRKRDNLHNGCKLRRLFAPIKRKSKYAEEGMLWSKFWLGGDTDFNFNEKKVNMMRNIIGNNDEAISMLEECHRYHHSLVNFSLMPATGGLNNFKGSNRFDRFDVFLKNLNDFYKNNSNKVLSAAKDNYEPLQNFLKTFQDIYDYCYKIYFISDRGFIERIIIEGSKEKIETRDDVLRYMRLAMDFWEKKEDAIKLKEKSE